MCVHRGGKYKTYYIVYMCVLKNLQVRLYVREVYV